MSDKLDIFLVGPPGWEKIQADEARAAGFSQARAVAGGTAFEGRWSHVWKANLSLRCTTRVLVRIDSFHAAHLAQLDKRARKVPWGDWLHPDLPVRVEAVSRGSQIYHESAAAQRVATAIKETLGAPMSADEGVVTVKLRIEKDLCTLSLDTSGPALHVRGHRQAVGKAPLRESLAALMLRACGYRGAEPVLDPMCGAGTFPIEAAGIAAGHWPGRDREFAFHHMPTFDPEAFAALAPKPILPPEAQYYGSDRDAGAIEGARANAKRAGVADLCALAHAPISALKRPDGPPGLVIVNPPYGERIGDKRALTALYAKFGQTMRETFSGWRVALVTSEPQLAKATGLPWIDYGTPISNGGIKVKLTQTKPL